MNNKTLMAFQYQDAKVRTVFVNGEPQFVAADVCKVLEISNTSQALSRLDDDERGIISNDTPNGSQLMTVVTESGLFSLILGSRKPIRVSNVQCDEIWGFVEQKEKSKKATTRSISSTTILCACILHSA